DAGRVFPDLSYRPVAHQIAATSTASLTGPANRWAKSPMSPLWFDPTAETWRAILPTSTGHRLFTLNEDGSATQGAVVAADQGARVNAVHHDGTTYVLIIPPTGDANFTFRRYDTSWAQIGSDVSIAFTGNTYDRDAQPVTLFRASTGHLWIAWNQGNRTLSLRRSQDDGVTWGGTNDTGNLTMSTAWNANPGPVTLAEDGPRLVLIAAANGGGGFVARTIAKDAASTATASWSSEAPPSMPSGITSDDHLSSIG